MTSRGGIVSRLKRKKIQEVISSGKRMDGRDLEDYREITIKTNVLEKSDGSAEAYLGRSRVLVGIKFSIGTPFEDTPNKGVLMCNSEFTPIASPAFEPGPPNEESIELARVVDRGLRSAETLDLSKYVLIPGKQVYLVFVDIYVLNYDGNLIDCAALAAIAALKNTKMPIYRVKDNEIEYTEKKKDVEILKTPIAVTMVKINDNIIVDPTADEEDVMDARLTITVDEDGNICTIQKSGSEGFSLEEIKKAAEVAIKKGKENLQKITETG